MKRFKIGACELNKLCPRVTPQLLGRTEQFCSAKTQLKQGFVDMSGVDGGGDVRYSTRGGVAGCARRREG